MREGAYVKKGQELIKLDDSNDKLLQEQLRGTEARLTSAQSDEQQAIAEVDRVQSEIEQINSQIREAKLNLQQSEGDTQGRIQQAKSNVAAAKAQLLQTQAQVKQTEAEVKLARINSDHTNLSNSYIEKLYATNHFIPKEWTGGNPARDAIDRGIAKVAVIIPPQFSRDIKAKKPITLQVLIDATDVNNARVIRGTIQRVTNFFMQQEGLLPATKRITARIRLWFNPGRLESLYIVPGVYGVILWIFPSLLTAIAMVREKEKGTILQVYTSSISATELLLGKGMAYLLIAITEALVVIGLGGIIFKLSVVNNPITLLLGTLIFLIDSVMFGLLVGVRSNNQNSAVQIISLVGFITSLLLSGFIYPLSNIPFPLSLVTNVVPARYYIDITRDAFLRGTGWSGVWFDFLMLIVLGLIFFNVSRRILSKMQIREIHKKDDPSAYALTKFSKYVM